MLNSDKFLKVSNDNHHFVKDGAPFFWLGDSIWSAFSQYSLEELEFYFSQRRIQGFTVEHVMIPWVGAYETHHSELNEYGEPIWIDNNPATPNDKYFTKVDKVIEIAKKNDLILAILACGGAAGTHIDRNKVITEKNVGAYGRWLGQRYKQEPNIIWISGWDLQPWRYTEIAYEFSKGIKEGDDGNHIICYHPGGAAGISSNYFQQEKWLAANFIQTCSNYCSIYNMVSTDYFRKPNKPVIHVEGAYEAGTEYDINPITSNIIRYQAYHAFLAGGYHTYGHDEIWRKTPGWRDTLNSLGSKHMAFLSTFFKSFDWWNIFPDSSLFFGIDVTQSGHVAACSKNGDFIIVYFYKKDKLEINLSKISKPGAITEKWFDPQTGNWIKGRTINKKETETFSSPAWCEDAILLLRIE